MAKKVKITTDSNTFEFDESTSVYKFDGETSDIDFVEIPDNCDDVFSGLSGSITLYFQETKVKKHYISVERGELKPWLDFLKPGKLYKNKINKEVFLYVGIKEENEHEILIKDKIQTLQIREVAKNNEIPSTSYKTGWSITLDPKDFDKPQDLFEEL